MGYPTRTSSVRVCHFATSAGRPRISSEPDLSLKFSAENGADGALGKTVEQAKAVRGASLLARDIVNSTQSKSKKMSVGTSFPLWKSRQ